MYSRKPYEQSNGIHLKGVYIVLMTIAIAKDLRRSRTQYTYADILHNLKAYPINDNYYYYNLHNSKEI